LRARYRYAAYARGGESGIYAAVAMRGRRSSGALHVIRAIMRYEKIHMPVKASRWKSERHVKNDSAIYVGALERAKQCYAVVRATMSGTLIRRNAATAQDQVIERNKAENANRGRKERQQEEIHTRERQREEGTLQLAQCCPAGGAREGEGMRRNNNPSAALRYIPRHSLATQRH